MNRNLMEERLIDFSVLITKIVVEMPNTIAGKHFAGHILKSGTSPALRFGESQSAESRQDVIQKMTIILQDLREAQTCLTIIKKSECHNSKELLNDALTECDELITIFVCSIHTSKRRCKATL